MLASLRYSPSPPVRFVRECLNHTLIAFGISVTSNLLRPLKYQFVQNISIYSFQVMFEEVIGNWLGSDTAIGNVTFTKNDNCSFLPDSARPVYVGGRQTSRSSDVIVEKSQNPRWRTFRYNDRIMTSSIYGSFEGHTFLLLSPTLRFVFSYLRQLRVATLFWMKYFSLAYIIRRQIKANVRKCIKVDCRDMAHIFTLESLTNTFFFSTVNLKNNIIISVSTLHHFASPTKL